MRRLCADMVGRLPDLAHVDLSRVLIAFCQTRRAVPYGKWAKLTPLRFTAGSLTSIRGGRTYTIQRVYDRDHREMLYILSFYLPRFFDQSLDEKLITVLHELWHISPDFDGDLRRHAGRCFAHGTSQRNYDAAMRRLAEAWLAAGPPADLYDFLHGTFADLDQRRGPVYGLKVPIPKIVPLPPAPP
jgi:hypothetical protein